MKERSFWLSDNLEFRINNPNEEWLLGIYNIPVTHIDADDEGEIVNERDGWMISLGLLIVQFNFYW